MWLFVCCRQYAAVHARRTNCTVYQRQQASKCNLNGICHVNHAWRHYSLHWYKVTDYGRTAAMQLFGITSIGTQYSLALMWYSRTDPFETGVTDWINVIENGHLRLRWTILCIRCCCMVIDDEMILLASKTYTARISSWWRANTLIIDAWNTIVGCWQTFDNLLDWARSLLGVSDDAL